MASPPLDSTQRSAVMAFFHLCKAKAAVSIMSNHHVFITQPAQRGVILDTQLPKRPQILLLVLLWLIFHPDFSSLILFFQLHHFQK